MQTFKSAAIGVSFFGFGIVSNISAGDLSIRGYVGASALAAAGSQSRR
jgi:hypothetical protein